MNFSNGGLSSVSVPQKKYISSFHLVVWIFAVSSPISDDQYRRMRKMYGETQEMISLVIRKRSGYQKTMEDIKACNKDCMVKILLDQVMYPVLIDLCQKEDKILEICFWDRTQMFNIQRPPEDSNLKPITVAYTFDEVLCRAEKQVQKWTKSYKTFQNTHILTHDFDRINRFRFILISFINMRESDFQGAFQQFRDFAINETMSLETHLTRMKNIDKMNTLSTEVKYYLGVQGEYYLKAKQFLKAQTQSQKEEFYNYVLKLYQEESFFYYILNSNLRMIGQTGFNRKQLMLPFSHVYNSIRSLYLSQVKKENPFYLKPFTAYRAERSKASFINNLRKKLQQMKQLDEKQKKVIKDHINLESYGGFSASLSAKAAVDRFSFFPQYKQRQQRKDRGIKQDKTSQSSYAQVQYERQTVNRIKFFPNPRLHEAGNENFLHGFVKLSQKQNKEGLIQQQILTNSFNVYRVTDIRQMKIIDLFTEEELEIHRRQEQTNEQQAQSLYRVTSIKTRFYNEKIIVIDMEFGPFYDEVLFEKNHFNLGHYEQKARQSYIYCINKMRRYNKFDYSDACFLLSELDECYKILKEKTTNNFQLSKQDGKNYFEQIAKICRMLGRVTEAKKYTNLAIQCHKQLQQVHLGRVYNTHYEKLYEMQMNAIQFYRECADLMDAHEGLNKALQLLQSKHFDSSDAKLRQSEVIMNIGINYYSRGKLDESIEKFIQCRVELLKLLEICNLEPQLSCYFSSYLKNIFCKDQDKEQRYCSYTEYGNKLKQIMRAEKIRQYGSQSQLLKNSEMASQMIELTHEAVKNRQQFFMKKQKYEKLIWNDIENNRVERKMQQELERQIKSCTTQMARHPIQSIQYQQLKEELEHLKLRLKKMEVSNFQEEGAETYINEYIKKFTQREQKRRLAQLQKKKDQFKSGRHEKIIQQYISCAQDIVKNIQELHKEGFVDQSSDIIAEKNRLAEVLHKSQRRHFALKQIDKIINLKLAQGQTRFYQFATACFTKGKILFELYQFQQAINSLEESIQYFNNFWKTQEKRAKQLNKEQAGHKESDHNNEYQLVRMMKIKVELKEMEYQQSKQKKISKRDDKLLKLYNEILELERIVKDRNLKQELSIRQLKCNICQIKIYYWTKMPQSLANEQRIFRYLKELIALNQLYEKGNSLKNILLLCDLATSQNRNDSFMAKFLQFKYDLQLQKARIECTNPSFEWIIVRALYYVYKYKIKLDSSEENIKKAQDYVTDSINLLLSLSKDPNKRHLQADFMDLTKERQNLRRFVADKKNSYVGTTLSTNPVRSRKQIIPVTQILQNSRDELYRQK